MFCAFRRLLSALLACELVSTRRAVALGVLLAAAGVLWCGRVQAASAGHQVELTDVNRSYPLGSGMWLLPDPEDTLDFDAARAAFAAGDYTAVQNERPRLDFKWKAAWVRVELVNRTAVRQWRFWQLPLRCRTTSVHLHFRPEGRRGRTFQHLELFSRHAPTQYPRRGLTIELELPRDTPAVLYLKYRGRLQAVTEGTTTMLRLRATRSSSQRTGVLRHAARAAVLQPGAVRPCGMRLYGYYVIHVGLTLFFFARNAHRGGAFAVGFGEFIARRWELTTVIVHWMIIIGVTGFFRLLFLT
ncbi:MAG: 7TM-DISM domain-containing protein [Polyangiaceae bacterium]